MLDLSCHPDFKHLQFERTNRKEKVMEKYATKFMVTGIKNNKLMNGNVTIVPINFGANEIKPGDTVSGDMIVEQFNDQNDPTKKVTMFKLLISKITKGKEVKNTESF